MSSEVCPYCGKSFKRLKSHLPHCKAAAQSSKGPPTSHHEETKASSSRVSSQTDKTKTQSSKTPPTSHHEETKASQLLSSSEPKKSKPQRSKSPPTHYEETKTSSSQLFSSGQNKTKPQSSKTPPTSHHEEIEASSSLRSSSEPDKSKPTGKKDKPVQTLTVDTKGSEKLVKSSTTSQSTKKKKLKLSEQIKMATKISSPAFVEPVHSSLTSKGQTKTDVSSQIVRETLAPVTNQDAKQTSALKKKQVKAMLTNKSSFNETKISGNNVKPNLKSSFSLEDEEKLENMWKPKAKITLQDVRTTLGRGKQERKKKRLLENIATDALKCETRPETKQNKVENAMVSVRQEVPSQVMALKPEKSELVLSKSEDFMSQLSKIQNRESGFTRGANGFKDGLRMDRHTMGLVSLASPARGFLEAEVSAKAFGKKDLAPVLRQNVERNGEVMEKRMGVDVRTRATANVKNNGTVPQQRLGQVTLRELPDWLVSRSPRRPRDVLDMAQSGWQWYYRRYIDVRKGGVGGVAMLLAGYCILSYIWSYPHLKRDRWRKYH